MSTVIATLALVPFALMSFYQCNHKKCWLKRAILTTGLTLGLTGNIWGSLLDVFSSNHIIPPFPETDMSNPAYAIMWNNGHLSLLSNIYITIGIITIAMLFIYHIHLNSLKRLIILTCILFLWLSSAYFPWSILSRHFVLIQQTIQFPKRFISIFVILLLIIFGSGMNSVISQFDHNNSIIPLITVILLVILSGNAVSQENHIITTHTAEWQSKQISITNSDYNPKMKLNQLRNADLSTNLSQGIHYFIKSTPDYVPTNHTINATDFKKLDPYDLLTKDIQRIQLKKYYTKKHHLWYGTIPIKNRLHFHKIIRGNKLLIRWHQPQSHDHERVTLPVVKYRHTQVKLDHQIINPKINRIGAIYLSAKSGNHQISLQYHASIWWDLIIYITIGSWLSLIGILLLKLSSI